ECQIPKPKFQMNVKSQNSKTKMKQAPFGIGTLSLIWHFDFEIWHFPQVAGASLLRGSPLPTHHSPITNSRLSPLERSKAWSAQSLFPRTTWRWIEIPKSFFWS
ncbi:MAG: hypothetical protein KAI38_06230, partial [Candidatus Latescibacteria bacterium]|nr:hypothetical protein [Candidatus Latescibacterota bacterium]